MRQKRIKVWYHVCMHEAWLAAGKPTPYRINLDTQVSRPAIQGYIDPNGVMLRTLPPSVVTVAQYLEVDWHNHVKEVEIEVDVKRKTRLEVSEAKS